MDIETMFEEIAPDTSGMSLDQMIREFVRLDKQIKELAYERSAYQPLLVEHAAASRNQQNTVHLVTADESLGLKVEFKSELAIGDQQEIECVKELLGDEKFNQLFATTYKPKAKTLKTFLNTKSADERTETAKDIIREHVKTVQRSPYVSIERA